MMKKKTYHENFKRIISMGTKKKSFRSMIYIVRRK